MSYRIVTLVILFSLFKICLLCGSEVTKPASVSECTDQSTDSNVCCMVSSPGYDPSEVKCVSLSNEEFTGQKLYKVGSEYWRLDCGSSPIYMEKGETCGNPDPMRPSDCWLTSSDWSSCCYYLSGNTTGTPGCMWLGEKKSGNVTENTPKRMLLTCSSNSLALYLPFVLILLLVLL